MAQFVNGELRGGKINKMFMAKISRQNQGSGRTFQILRGSCF